MDLMQALLALEQAAAVVATLLPDDPEQRDRVAEVWAPPPRHCKTGIQRQVWRASWLAWVDGAGDSWPTAGAAFEAPDYAHRALIAWATACVPASPAMTQTLDTPDAAMVLSSGPDIGPQNWTENLPQ